MDDAIKNNVAADVLGVEPQGQRPTLEFLARRRAKNFAVLALVLGLVVVIFIMTILKMQAGGG